MIAIASIIAAFAVCVAMLLTLYRLAVGPDAVDRVVALDTLVINTIALIVLLAIIFNTSVYFEAALLFAMVGFVTTVSFCKFLLRGNVIE
ncbi:K+/H+ antiporter subunit F [Xanthobacter sp. TB0139]|uniref:K+/H+ antiporter subunit F n=1 Tax=Xanthobacter sp. TB0139 TaxID=3459178 RepID=UPI0040393CAB